MIPIKPAKGPCVTRTTSPCLNTGFTTHDPFFPYAGMQKTDHRIVHRAGERAESDESPDSRRPYHIEVLLIDLDVNEQIPGKQGRDHWLEPETHGLQYPRQKSFDPATQQLILRKLFSATFRADDKPLQSHATLPPGLIAQLRNPGVFAEELLQLPSESDQFLPVVPSRDDDPEHRVLVTDAALADTGIKTAAAKRVLNGRGTPT